MEIKFRVWDSKVKFMINWNAIIQAYDLHNMLKSKDTRFEVMQFTGLLDKNGKAIYVGDILIWNKGEEGECTIIIKPKDELGIYYEVLKQKDKNIIAFDIRFYRSEESAEIIGNKFEKITKKVRKK